MKRAQQPSKHDLPLFKGSSPELRNLARAARAQKRTEDRAQFWATSHLNPASPNYGQASTPRP